MTQRQQKKILHKRIILHLYSSVSRIMLLHNRHRCYNDYMPSPREVGGKYTSINAPKHKNMPSAELHIFSRKKNISFSHWSIWWEEDSAFKFSIFNNVLPTPSLFQQYSLMVHKVTKRRKLKPTSLLVIYLLFFCIKEDCGAVGNFRF